jgi:hypothetical protein
MPSSAGRLFLLSLLAVAVAACDGGPPPPMVMSTDDLRPEPPPDPNLVPVVGDLGGPVENYMGDGPRGCQFETPPCDLSKAREDRPENQTGTYIPPGNGRAMPVATQQPPPTPAQPPVNPIVPLLGAVGLFVPGMMDNSMGSMGGMHMRH